MHVEYSGIRAYTFSLEQHKQGNNMTDLKERIRKNHKMSLRYKEMKKMKWFYLLLLPTALYFIIFKYLPMYGIILAFKDFNFKLGIIGSPWVGLKHFRSFTGSYAFYRLMRNTLTISLLRLLFGFPAPILLALFINELKSTKFKRTIQTISYLPHFISWVIIAGIMKDLLSPSYGLINNFSEALGGERVYYLADTNWFIPIMIASSVWKGVGWGTIVYLATISSIDQQLYDAAKIDGATRFQQARFITIPSLSSVITILLILSLGGILNAGFDQIFNLYSPAVYKVADILDTYVYRVGLQGMQFSFATAIGLFKTLIGCILVLSTNLLVSKMSGGERGIW